MKVLDKRLVVSLVLVLLVFTLGSKAYAERLIVVTGDGSIQLKPDMATISLSSITEDKSQAKAMEGNAVKMNKLIESYVKTGIKKEDIRTENISVYPVYDYSQGKQVFLHYRATNTISIDLKDMARLSSALDLAGEQGADSIGPISFSSSRSKEAYNEALLKAVLDAQAKADTIAKGIGVSLKGPIKIEETSSSHFYEYDSLMKEALVEDGANKSTPIELRDLIISGSVKIEYAY